MKYPNIIQLEVSGKYALFTDPLTKSGGEKCSYPVPTYEALKGLISSVYWVPAIRWVIDSVRVMEPVRTESRCIRIKRYFNNDSDISMYTYLRDVRYRITAHFVSGQEPLLPADEHRHYRSALRAIQRGGRRYVFLGTKDCPCTVTQCDAAKGEGYYDDVSADIGVMFHSFTYGENGEPSATHYFRCCMENGFITFPTQQECLTLHPKGAEYHVV